MRLFRFTVRRLMFLVGVASLALHLSVTAIRVWHDPESSLLHRWKIREREGGLVAREHNAPFWPKYWRRVVGLSWPGSYSCSCELWMTKPERPRVTVSAGWDPIQNGAVDIYRERSIQALEEAVKNMNESK